MNYKKNESGLPGLTCRNCRGFIFRHVAVASGTCPHCHIRLLEEEYFEKGSGI